MAAKKLIDRFREAFKDPAQVNAEEYQKIIEENAAKASVNVEGLTFRLLGLVAALVLIARGEIERPNLFGLGEIPNVSIILIALLPLVSYTQYDLLSTLSKFDQLSVIYKVIVKRRHRILHDQGLSKYFLFPPTLYDYIYSASDGLGGQAQSFLWLAEFVAITILIPLGAELLTLFNLTYLGELDYLVLLAAALVTTFVFNLQSVLIVIALFRGTSNE